MKKSAYIAIAATISLLGLSACSSSGSTSTSKSATTKSKKVVTDDEAFLEVPISQPGTDAQAAAEPKEADPQKLYGEWTLRRIRGKRYDGVNRAHINLDFKNGKMYGNTGYNVVNADFTCNDSQIRFTNIITSVMDAGSSERNILKALEETTNYVLQTRNNVEYITFKDSHGRNLLSLKRQNLDFLNGAWTVKALPDVDVTGNSVCLVIDIDQRALHGDSGCNIINGDITIDTEKDWAIQFDNLMSTRKACPDMAVETALLVALEDAVAVQKVSDKEMKLIDKRDSTVVTLQRLNLKK